MKQLKHNLLTVMLKINTDSYCNLLALAVDYVFKIGINLIQIFY